MPTNVSPEYKQAEADYRQAREPRERLECLQEMLRTIPKHKGTENLQADIKTRIKQLRDELTGPRKGAHRSGPAYVIRSEGAAQLSLIGPPNVGKSSLHDRLTRSGASIGAYPFTTQLPQPGMMLFEDIQFQLIDLPPLAADFMESWYVNALQPADAALLVVDLSQADCVEQVQMILQRLADKRVALIDQWPGLVPNGVDAGRLSANGGASRSVESEEAIDNPFQHNLPTVVVSNKVDLGGGDEVSVMQELLGTRMPTLSMSAKTGEGVAQLGAFLARSLQIVRVYTRIPGKAVDLGRPFTVRQGGTVRDVARLVHKDIAESLKYARLWGGGQFAGQQVSAEHQVSDGDIIELHSDS